MLQGKVRGHHLHAEQDSCEGELEVWAPSHQQEFKIKSRTLDGCKNATYVSHNNATVSVCGISFHGAELSTALAL